MTVFFLIYLKMQFAVFQEQIKPFQSLLLEEINKYFVQALPISDILPLRCMLLIKR